MSTAREKPEIIGDVKKHLIGIFWPWHIHVIKTVFRYPSIPRYLFLQSEIKIDILNLWRILYKLHLKVKGLTSRGALVELNLIRTYYRRSCYPSLEEICKPNPGAYFKQRKYVKEVLCCTITPSLRWSHRAYLPPIPPLISELLYA